MEGAFLHRYVLRKILFALNFLTGNGKIILYRHIITVHVT